MNERQPHVGDDDDDNNNTDSNVEIERGSSFLRSSSSLSWNSIPSSGLLRRKRSCSFGGDVISTSRSRSNSPKNVVHIKQRQSTAKDDNNKISRSKSEKMKDPKKNDDAVTACTAKHQVNMNDCNDGNDQEYDTYKHNSNESTSLVVNNLLIKEEGFHPIKSTMNAQMDKVLVMSSVIWRIHFGLAILVLVWGNYTNQNPKRKYIFIRQQYIDQGGQGQQQQQKCRKFFVNALASSNDDIDSTMCCTDTINVGQDDVMNSKSIIYDNLCCTSSRKSYMNYFSYKLPLAARLSKFPDAWILPLFPLMLRLLYWLVQIVKSHFLSTVSPGDDAISQTRDTVLVDENQSNNCTDKGTLTLSTQRASTNNIQDSNNNNDESFDHPITIKFNNRSNSMEYGLLYKSTTTKRMHYCFYYYHILRFLLYIVIMVCRGWILYIVLNRLEKIIVRFTDLKVYSTLPTTSATISNNTTSTMSSDTSVVVEDDCWYQRYLPNNNNNNQYCTGREFDFSDHIVLYYSQILPIPLMETIYSFQYPYWDESNIVWPVLVVFCQLYLHLITSAGAYKTTAYFHTGEEILVGFVVSSLVAIPLWRLQCSTKKWACSVRSYVFGTL